MANVDFRAVTKSFGAFTALHGLDLSIKAGEFVALLGPSGCGKTTTLRMLAGLEFPTTGDIIIGDRRVNDLPPGERDIAMVFQSYALYPHMTVAENIAYPLKKRGVPKAERGPMVARTAEMLHLTALLDRKPKQLSGGQQQRVALGRALIRDPKVFLLDEPLSNLDAKLRGQLRAELIELHRRLGRTMVYVTHDQLEAMTMADRIAIMEGGNLQQFAPPAEVYARPANRFVAGFIGTPGMTLIDGTLVQEGGGWVFESQSLRLSVPPLAAHAAAGPAAFGIRPEDVHLGSGDLSGEVVLTEATGHETIVTVALSADIRVIARIAGTPPLRIGDRVPVRLDAARAHLFAAGPHGTRLNHPSGAVGAGEITDIAAPLRVVSKGVVS
ncbi:ABC transporter ATP-binding protein [Pseudotabrizicola algicola]|uniref:ABC transporter ATP-binding protein n=1 Tax=Pseudotabrizicola algicola TaxID=2709381 RepID=A0A6B3RML1_9RHOB|nr:ABC transporter ATP-binding protein [Pseudotabrizicola algicola]NEX46691.1 ABC transporter ATP-binding protein [Pseudotabrizicola algicola]